MYVTSVSVHRRVETIKGYWIVSKRTHASRPVDIGHSSWNWRQMILLAVNARTIRIETVPASSVEYCEIL